MEFANAFTKRTGRSFIWSRFVKKLYTNLEMLLSDLDAYLHYYNHARTHQGKLCCARTAIAIWKTVSKAILNKKW